MFKGIRRGVLWAIVHYSHTKGNLSRSLACLEKIDQLGGLKPYQKAYKGNLLLGLGSYQAAKDVLIEVVEETERELSTNKRYIHLYSKAILYKMHGDLEVERHALAEASKLDIDPNLSEWLPLFAPKSNQADAKSR